MTRPGPEPDGSTAAPRIRALRLPELGPAAVADLAPDGVVEGARLAGAELAGRSLRGLSLTDCELASPDVEDTDLTATRFRSVAVRGLDTVRLRAPGSTWREVVVERSRIASAELHDAVLDNVVLRGCRLGFVNLRGATLTDVLLTDCVVDELDLSDAGVTRLAVRDTAVRSLTVRGARLADVDLRGGELAGVDDVTALRGATVTGDQLLQLAPLFADAAGIRVQSDAAG